MIARHSLAGTIAIKLAPQGPLCIGLKETAEESMIAALSLRHAAKNPSGTLETFRSYNILLYGTQTPSLTWS